MKFPMHAACLSLATALWSGVACALGALENPQPGQAVSGITTISGWHCQATRIDIRFDGKTTFSAGARTSRADTQATCGHSDTGYALLFNWNTLGPGPHTVLAIADGFEFARADVVVTTLGAEFLTGRSGSVRLDNFPDIGKGVMLQWQESQQNFAVTQLLAGVPSINDYWYGSVFEDRSNCTHPENNGSRGTYATFIITTTDGSIHINITDALISLTCDYTGSYNQTGNQRQATGTFTCNSGTKTGTWASSDFTVTDSVMAIRYTSQLTGTETCSITGLFGGARRP
jgi:hypothetical protein